MKKFAVGACLVLIFVSTLEAQISIVPFNDTWKYLDNGTNQGTAWRSGGFSDASWNTGTAKFGYGISDANTIISFGPDSKNKYVTTYFRKTINIPNPGAFASYEASIKRDDGTVVYVNGTEVYRSNLPAGSINYNTLASTAGTDNGNTGQVFTINSSFFVTGVNTIAVEIHQEKINAAEKDMAFDMSLSSSETIPPVVVSINRQVPSTTPTNASSVTFRASFSEAVTGVDVPDFLLTITSGTVSGTVTSVSPVSGTVYDVNVTSINGNGIIRLDLKSTGTGIADAAGNAIATGFTSGQAYTISQTVPTLTSVAIVSNNPTPSLAKTGNIISLSFTASEPVSTPIVTIATKPATVTAGGSNSYTATYTLVSTDAAGIVPFTINFSSTAGTPGAPVTTTTNGSTVTFDKTLPAVLSINRQVPSTTTTNASSVTFRASFSEAVTGVDVPAFLLTITSGTVSGTVTSVSPVSGTVYDVNVTSINGNGIIRLDLKSTGTGIADAAGNAIATGFTSGQAYTISQTVPTLTSVAIVSNNPTPSLAKTGNIISLSFTASEPVSTPIVTIATKPATVTAGGSNSYTATYTLVSTDAAGIVPFTINFSSTAGTPGAPVTTTTNGSTVTFDKTLPAVVSINRQVPSTATTNASSVTFRASFSEAVTGVDVPDFLLTITSGTVSGTVTSVSPVSGTVYDVNVTSINGNGIIRLDLKSTGTGIADAAGNAIATGFTSGQAYTISQTVPTLTSVAIVSNNPTPSLAKTGNIISLSFTASEPVNTPTVTIATHAVTATAGSGNSYTATYTMLSTDAAGIVPFTINFSSTAGTPGAPVTTTTNGSTVTFDKTLPAVVSINRQVPSTTPTNASSVTFRASFSEAVSGVDLPDFLLTITSGTVSGTVTSVSPVSGTVYDVNVTSINGNGIIRLDLKSTGTGIADAAGNAIATGFTSGQAYTISQTVPTLTSVAIVSNNPTPSLAKTGNIISLSFTASEPVNTPVVTIATKPATVTAGGSNSYTATYTMVSTDAAGIVPFTINFSSTGGVTGAPVTTTTNSSTVTFDKTAPTVTSINRQLPLTQTTTLSSVKFRATFNEQVSGVTTPDFLLSIISGSVSGTISSVTPVSGTVYDVTVSSISGAGTLRLDLNNTGTGIADAAGNAITSGFTAGQTYIIDPTTTQPGFTSIVPLTPVNIKYQTKDKPQAKAWNYANQWWCCLSAAVGGTKIYRLDGTSWTEILTLTTGGTKPDCWVVGDLVHVLLYNDDHTLLSSVKYDVATNTYKLWNVRPTSVAIALPSGNETATLVVDGTGRMWIATAGTTDVSVWWSDAPYSTWSAPIIIASGVNDDDICSLTTIPSQNKIAILWSNQTTKRYGFRTHTNGASPNTWSADEMPASQSAIDNVGKGMADDHINIVVASDGTLYCAAKTGYDNLAYPESILLVRRPSGTWDNAHTVTNNGTQAVVVLNEVQGKVKVIYTTATGGGIIAYRESSTSSISFGAEMILMNGTLNYASSTHQTYNPDVVIMATDETSTPFRALSVLASDASTSPQPIVTQEILIQDNAETTFKAYPNPFNSSTNLSFRMKKSGYYSIIVYDSKGMGVYTLDKGWADAGQENIRKFNKASLPSGFYIVSLKTSDNISTIKLLKN